MLTTEVIRKIKKYWGKLSLLVVFRFSQLFVRARLSNVHENKKIVLFFLPEMAVELYAKMLVSIAERIRDCGYEPVFFGCNGFLNNCLLQDRLSSRSPLFKNASVCVRCHTESAGAANKYNLNYLECKRSGVRTISFFGSTVDERLAYFYKEIPVGRLAYYDLSIKFKRDRTRRELSQKEILYYDSTISDGVGIIDFLDQNKSSVCLNAVVAIDEYSLANVVREWARVNSISAFRAGFSYHFNADPQFVTLSSTKTRASEKCDRASRWKMWRDIPLPAPVIDEIASDLIFRMSGTGGHIFSSNYTGDLDSLLVRYGLRREIKTLVVFASANDEIDAISELSTAMDDQFEVQDAFESQIAWLEAIVAYARHNDVQVIIKMHPRLSKSHRDAGSAEDIHIYRALAETSPNNVVFLWPEANVSAYDILQLADCCLTSWGTMGLESAKLGVPVVTGMTKITFATPGLTLFSKAESEQQFYRLISEPKAQICVDDLAEVFRWHHLMHMSGAIILEGDRDINLYGEEFGCNFADVLLGADIEDKKYEFLSLRSMKDSAGAEQEERDAILAAVHKLIYFFEPQAKAKSFNSKLVNRLTLIKDSLETENSVGLSRAPSKGID
jgi:hypothetical protein